MSGTIHASDVMAAACKFMYSRAQGLTSPDKGFSQQVSGSKRYQMLLPSFFTTVSVTNSGIQFQLRALCSWVQVGYVLTTVMGVMISVMYQKMSSQAAAGWQDLKSKQGGDQRGMEEGGGGGGAKTGVGVWGGGWSSGQEREVHLDWSPGGCPWGALAEKVAAPHTDAHSVQNKTMILYIPLFCMDVNQNWMQS